MTAEEIVARLIYRDGLMLVIDKPAGLAVHKGPKGGESLEDYFDALRFGLPRRPALAHRLDRDTSGCLVLGRHHKALAALGRLFKSGRVGKSYWAVVAGGPTQEEGRIDLPLGRKDAARGWWMKHDPTGQPAVTTWKVMGRTHDVAARNDQTGVASGGMGISWLALEPLTGRTHQLRVHCAAMGWPIIGDSVYGSAPRTGGARLHLHAREVVVPLYSNRAPIRVTAPVPSHMQNLLRACGWPDESVAE
jgi:tRNA pseudouridine32 synthase / 23S rRNA pseudouridine746 synthase